MAIAVVGTPPHNGVTNASSIAVTITGVTAGNLLVCGVSILQGSSTTAQALITPTDTNGTWADAGSAALALDVSAGIRHGVMQAYQKNCSAGSHTVTYTFPNGGTYAEMSVAEVSGADATAPYDSAVTSRLVTVDTTAHTPLTVGATGSLAQADNLILAVFEAFAPSTGIAGGIADPPSGYTKIHAQQAVNSTVGAQHSYKVVSSTAGVSASWTWTADPDITAVAGSLSAFKAAAAAGGAGSLLGNLVGGSLVGGILVSR